MSIEGFAEQHRLKTKREDCGEVIIAGKQGQIYEYSSAELGVMFMSPSTEADPCGRWCPKVWGNFMRAAVAAGMTVRQHGDTEGCLSFDAKNKQQARLAIKIAGARPKRHRTPEQVARFVAAIQNAKNTASGPLTNTPSGVVEREVRLETALRAYPEHQTSKIGVYGSFVLVQQTDPLSWRVWGCPALESS